jgi:hypothetical protein
MEAQAPVEAFRAVLVRVVAHRQPVLSAPHGLMTEGFDCEPPVIRPHLQFAGSPDVFLRYLLQPQPGVHIPTVRRPKRLFPGSALRLAGAAVTIRMRAGATAPATLSLPVPGGPTYSIGPPWTTSHGAELQPELRPSDRAGVHIRVVQEVLDRTRVTTTERYTYVATRQMRDASERGDVGPGMSATATQTATLGCLVRQALSLRIPGEGLRAAEDRGFEPRKVSPPNRISSAAP